MPPGLNRPIYLLLGLVLSGLQGLNGPGFGGRLLLAAPNKIHMPGSGRFFVNLTI